MTCCHCEFSTFVDADFISHFIHCSWANRDPTESHTIDSTSTLDKFVVPETARPGFVKNSSGPQPGTSGVVNSKKRNIQKRLAATKSNQASSKKTHVETEEVILCFVT